MLKRKINWTCPFWNSLEAFFFLKSLNELEHLERWRLSSLILVVKNQNECKPLPEICLDLDF